MAVEQKDGLVDLEKELSCSICTEVLYQPLTLLDCLHTFCGSCLREWFTWQASNATAPHPYTCPSCRSPVRDTRPNATVTTLLDMYLKAHPEKIKPVKEREEIARSYKPGDNVIPTVRHGDRSDSDDEQMLEEARELSLRDNDAERSRRRAERAERHQRRRRQHDHAVASAGHHPPEGLGRNPQPSRFVNQDRHVEHQSSLRSLLSASDIDSHEMEEEIMRQITDDGLLEGIDLNSLTPAQEEEITERIAQAFRRRQNQQQSRTTDRPRSEQTPQAPAISSALPRQRQHNRSESGNIRHAHERPPISRPYLLEASADDSRRQRDRSTSTHSQHIRNRSGSRPREHASHRPASHSTTDLSTTEGQDHRRRVSRDARTATDPEMHATSGRSFSDRAISTDTTAGHRGALPSQRAQGAPRAAINAHTASPLARLVSREGPSNSSSPALLSSRASTDGRRPSTSPASTSNTHPSSESNSIPDISVACSRCSRPDIQHNLHYHCLRCDSGNFNVCLQCYRTGKGCKHWFGHGYLAFIKFRRLSLPAGTEEPHILRARRYRRKNLESRVDGELLRRLEEGLFCEGCLSYADTCYWHCDICQDGAWGYCNTCVQTGRHCTHPLEAMVRRSKSKQVSPMMITTDPASNDSLNSATANADPGQKVLPHVDNPAEYTSLGVSSYCDICHRSIPPSHTRFHCFICNEGNYDICTPCYHNLCSTGRIGPENGSQGWRRCLRGHRMTITGFEDREGGQKRVVVREMVGGWALKEDEAVPSRTEDASDRRRERDGLQQRHWRWKESDGSSVSHLSPHAQQQVRLQPQSQQSQKWDIGTPSTQATLLPPDGGVGLRVQALWSYFPPETSADELSFPRHAEIREAEDINGDWFWGVYAGSKGLFPGNYGREVR